jgi:2-polyprenyl-6-hydroxyphenyl methylase / 3-demethylubiquinone-9 3-methyltransferase
MKKVDNTIYDRIPNEWWSDDSFMALLRHSVNPARFAYFKRALLEGSGVSLAGLSVLDVGCGGGLLSEQFAAEGCNVVGLDQSAPTLEAATAHALASGLAIEYRQGNAQALPFQDTQFDVVCCCDVLEHVDSVQQVITEIARVLKPGGMVCLDTINRTWLSKLLAIKVAQDWPLTRMVPRDVHVWEQFVTPQELTERLEQVGFAGLHFSGLTPSMNPFRALSLFIRHKLGRINFAAFGHGMVLRESSLLSLAYMGVATKQGGSVNPGLGSAV